MRTLVLLLVLVNFAVAQKIPAFSVTDDELVKIAQKLRDVDENGAKRGQIQINYQQHTTTRDDSDAAKDKFFTKVDSSLLRKPSYELYLNMMDNFNKQTGVTEPKVSEKEEKDEVGKFLTHVLATKPMQELYSWFKQKKHPIATNPTVFRYWIGQLWFSHYSRALGRPDTSGFEHVFIGEIKNNEVSGMHNWLRFYTLEKNSTQNFDYKGYIVKRFNVMAALKFKWDRDLKRSGSILIGTSPEFDMALYTLCFLSRRGRDTCNVELNGCPLQITSYEIYQQNKVYIGSIFPSAGRITEQCRRQNS
ncbi:unnamed protein product [Caenorhabditis angaria]|uniref:EndoU domain-containing protein n=1 Tax=Caenorhabditis angaria TaxID=860376 RepID=A0A9P1I5U8_9PELO|nr:unnamed protein product [Caenorhabditis angaria]